jgi:hypothetical protein
VLKQPDKQETTIGAVDRLVDQVMTTKPYRSARRVFWITDNCSSHRGEKAAARLRAQWPNATLVQTPVHASWLNQIEIYFSIVQRKVVTSNDCTSLRELEGRLLAFQGRYEQAAKPFQSAFTWADLVALLAKLKGKELGRVASPENTSPVIVKHSTKRHLQSCRFAISRKLECAVRLCAEHKIPPMATT